MKNVSRDQSLFPAYWGTALLTTGASSSVLFLAVLALSRFALPATIPLLLVLLVSGSDLVGLNIITMCGQAFQAFDRLQWTATINVLVSRQPAERSADPGRPSSGIRHLCNGATYTSSARRSSQSPPWCWSALSSGAPRFGWQRAPGEVREGFYFSAGLSAQTIYNDLDKTMLARLGTLQATGIYGAALSAH